MSGIIEGPWKKVGEEATREPTLADYLIDPPANDYWQGYNAGVEVVWSRVEQLEGAVSDLLAFAQAVLDLPCPSSRDADPLAAQQRRASELITTCGER